MCIRDSCETKQDCQDAGGENAYNNVDCKEVLPTCIQMGYCLKHGRSNPKECSLDSDCDAGDTCITIDEVVIGGDCSEVSDEPCTLLDCDGQPYCDWLTLPGEIALHQQYKDGVCDEGYYGVNFNCDDKSGCISDSDGTLLPVKQNECSGKGGTWKPFAYDGGDCSQTGFHKIQRECTDCQGKPCPGYLTALGDGVCDNGKQKHSSGYLRAWDFSCSCTPGSPGCLASVDFQNDLGDCKWDGLEDDPKV